MWGIMWATYWLIILGPFLAYIWIWALDKRENLCMRLRALSVLAGHLCNPYDRGKLVLRARATVLPDNAQNELFCTSPSMILVPMWQLLLDGWLFIPATERPTFWHLCGLQLGRLYLDLMQRAHLHKRFHVHIGAVLL